MADTANLEQENISTEAEQSQERTFTQSELDNIVESRLERERKKYADYETLKGKALKFDEMEEANKSELQRATERADKLQSQLDSIAKENELRNLRDKVSKDTGVPSNLLTGMTEEDCMEQAYGILAFRNSGSYPTVKDGGEVTNTHSKRTEADQFADWFNAVTKK